MFDYVRPAEPVECPSCGLDLFMFQTKDGGRDLRVIPESTLSQQGIRSFYELCPGCHGWIEFTADPPQARACTGSLMPERLVCREREPIPGYAMSFRAPEKP